MQSKFHLSFLSLLICYLLSACGAGGAASGGTSLSTGSPTITGIDGTGGELPGNITKITSVGAITSDFGITVNGITFDTDNAEVVIDGQAGSASQLSVGQIVTVVGELGSDQNQSLGTANSVEFNTNIKGEIQSVNRDEQTIEVLNQLIRLSDGVVYGENLSENNLSEGQLVSVSAFRRANGQLSASRIDLTVDNMQTVTGTIANLNIGSTTFAINQLTVNYSDVNLLESLSNGQVVKVQGQKDSNGVLIASSVQVLELFLADSDVVELEGFPEDIIDQFNFTLNGVTVQARYATEYVGGLPNQLSEHSRIEVEGSVNANGVLEATRIIYHAAVISSHKHNQVLESSSETFQWNDVGADACRLVVKNFHGERTVFFDEILPKGTTSAKIENLPTNSARVYVGLSTLHGNRWMVRHYEFLGAGFTENAKLLDYKWGDQLNDTTVTFSWNDVGAQSYQLVITNIDEIFRQTVDGNTTSITVHDLPNNGSQLSIFLNTIQDKWVGSERYNVTSVSLVDNAELMTHSDQEVLKSTTQVFTWSDVNAEAYRIRILNDSYLHVDETVDGSVTSISVSGLPRNGAKLRFMLITKKSGWANKDYVFYGYQEFPAAELVSPTEGAFKEVEPVLTWTSSPEAKAYRVQVYDPQDGFRKLSETTLDPTSLSMVLTGLSNDGKEVLVRLGTQHGEFWVYNGYRFKTIVTE